LEKYRSTILENIDGSNFATANIGSVANTIVDRL